jgi:hypothetical protein
MGPRDWQPWSIALIEAIFRVSPEAATLTKVGILPEKADAVAVPARAMRLTRVKCRIIRRALLTDGLVS